MKTMKRNSKQSRRGLVLPLIAAIALCLALLGIGILQLGFGSRVMSAMVMSEISAREAADAGLARALYSMNYVWINNQPIPLGAHGPETLDNPYGSNVSYIYEIQRDALSPIVGAFRITSTGTSGREQRTVYALTRMSSQFEYALFVTNNIEMKSGSMVDGYNSDPSTGGGPYGGSNQGRPVQIGSNSTQDRQGSGDEGIFLLSGAHVIGDVAVGVGGEPGVVIDADENAISGNTYAMMEPYVWSPILMPSPADYEVSLPTINYHHDTRSIGIGGTITTAQTIECAGIDIGNSGVLEVSGNVQIHVTGNISLLGSSTEIRIMPGSSLRIYLDGAFDSGNSTFFNVVTMDPKRFILYGTGSTEVTWTVRYGGNFYGVIYAPKANLEVYNSGDIFGSISARSCEMKNSGSLHYDLALANPVLFPAGYVIDRWWERIEPVAPTP